MPNIDALAIPVRGILIAPDVSLMCSCTKYGFDRCVVRATQEDGLCNTCRDGCTRVTLTCEGQTKHHTHVKEPAWVEEARREKTA
jgi:hypothetical protein